MRQVFTSQRLETVEGVARLLEEAGIAVHISNGRSYKGGMGGQFSFSDPKPARKQPALWIKHPADQPRAREILRNAGLLDTTRPDQGSGYVFREAEDEAPRRGNWGWRIRIGLLVLIAVAAFLTLNRFRQTQPARQAAAPPVQATPVEPVQPASARPAEEEVRVQLQPAQAKPK